MGYRTGLVIGIVLAFGIVCISGYLAYRGVP